MDCTDVNLQIFIANYSHGRYYCGEKLDDVYTELLCVICVTSSQL